MLNRTEQPSISKIDTVEFLEPQHFLIDKETKLHWISSVDDESVKIDFIFNAGTKNDKVYLGNFVSDLLLSGTDSKTADEINAQIDGLGGFFQSDASRESAMISIYGLRKNIQAILQVVIDALSFVSFPQTEVDLLMQRKKEGFKVSSEKVSFLARRAFGKLMFEDTPYASQIEVEDFDTVTVDELKDFHQKYYLNGLRKVCVVGNITTTEINHLIEQLKPWCNIHPEEFAKVTESKSGEVRIEKEGAIQSAIRVGRILFNRKHKDSLSFSVANGIYGGYFGSRLMSNIREDKGYTYGIGSGVAELRETGYFFISTEVGKDVADAALAEVKKEMEILRTELVSEEELITYKNYSIGQLLKGSDGPNAMMDRFLGIDKFGLGYEHYAEIIETIHAITPEKVREMAQEYLVWDKMRIIVAG